MPVCKGLEDVEGWVKLLRRRGSERSIKMNRKMKRVALSEGDECKSGIF